MDQLTTEEPEMGALFVDQVSDAALEDLNVIRTRLAGVIGALESAGDDYKPAWRMLLAAEAAIDHGVARLHQAKQSKHSAWQVRQREAREFLILRAQGSGRVFRVLHTYGRDGRRYVNIPDVESRFSFTLERTPFGWIAELKVVEPKPNQVAVMQMALQTLHRAFLAGAIDEIDTRPVAVSTPAPLGGLRLEEPLSDREKNP